MSTQRYSAAPLKVESIFRFASLQLGRLDHAAKDVYDPTDTDMLRVALAVEFRRYNLNDLLPLLERHNPDSKEDPEAELKKRDARLRRGLIEATNETMFEGFTTALRTGGFFESDLLWRPCPINFAYTLYLLGKQEGLGAKELAKLLCRWVAMAVLTGRYAEKPEAAFERDVCRVDAIGLKAYSTSVIAETLPEAFWTSTLPRALDIATYQSPHFHAYQASQVFHGDRPFLCQQMTIRRWLLWDRTIGHVYPKLHLKHPSDYKQVANLVIIPIGIERDIRYTQPKDYFRELADQCNGGETKYGDITDHEEMQANFRMNSLPESLLDGNVPDYKDFLEERRQLMAQKIKQWFERL
jgi:hypothetical protein